MAIYLPEIYIPETPGVAELDPSLSPGTAHLRLLGGEFEQTFHPRAYVVPLSPVKEKIGFYMVKRFVEHARDDVFADGAIEQVLYDNEEGGFIPDAFSVTVTSVADGRNVRRRYIDDSDDELLERYERAAVDLSPSRFCQLGELAMFGSRELEADFPKHIVLTLDQKSQKRLLKERHAILSNIGGLSNKLLRAKGVPHITLFKTRDLSLALKVLAELTEATQFQRPVKLGKAESFAID